MSFGLTDIQFELDYIDFEHNRMYPPNYRKESIMKRPSMKHADAVRACILLLESGQQSSFDPKVKKRIGKDIDLMCELHEILLHIIENPTLPFTGFPLQLASAESFELIDSDEPCDGI
ncbi:hypothetical protein ES703_43262 [subsurface metagenome]